LAIEGRWILYGLLSGNVVKEFNMGMILWKRIELIGTTLRSRTDEFKKRLVEEFNNELLPLI
jgi:tumor protein p53-inducible protein 3